MTADRSHLTAKQITDKNGKQTTVHVNEQKGDGSGNADKLGGVAPTTASRPQRPLRTVIDMYGDVIDDNQVISKGDDVLTAEGYTVAYEDSYAKTLDEGEFMDYDDIEFLSQIDPEGESLATVTVYRADHDTVRVDVARHENFLWREDDDGNNVDGFSEKYLNDNSHHVDSFFKEEYGAEVYGDSWDGAHISISKEFPADTLTESRLIGHAIDMNSKFAAESDPGTFGFEYYGSKMKAHIEREQEKERQEHRDRYNARPVSADEVHEALGKNGAMSSFGDGNMGESTTPFGGSYSLIKNSDTGEYEVDESQLEGWETITDGMTGQYGYNGPVMHDSEYIDTAFGEQILKTPGNYVKVPAEYYDGESFESESEGWVVLREKNSENEFHDMGFDARE